MLAIGRGMMAEPRLLILDEPSLGLSPLLVEEMFALIRRLNGDGLGAILLVEQNVGAVAGRGGSAYVLENGAVRFQGRPAELLASRDLKRAFLGVSTDHRPLRNRADARPEARRARRRPACRRARRDRHLPASTSR